MEKKRFKFEDRPTCSCGVKMKLVKYRGYYDDFLYWDCDNCKIYEKMNESKPDKENSGAYV